MAKSRQQLINASSFLSDQKEKLGGLNVKRSTITADSFKKGTSQESSDNIEKRVAANEKKITLLKNIIKAQKSDLGENLRSLEPEQESKSDQQQMGSPLLESLQSIASTVDSIRDTLIQQQDNDKSVAESMRREKEEDERKGQEKGLESSKPNILQKVGDTVMKPVMGLFGRIFNFLKTLFLGKILMNFIDWFSNPANQGKIQTLVRFVKDWWPALTAAVLLFGTGFGGLVAGLIKTIMLFIPAMGAAITKLKAAKFMSAIPGVGKIGAIAKVAAPLALAGGVGYGIGRMQGGDDQQEPLQMNKGGTVPGSGNKDTVPAMLTPGEFVMSKGAVQEYGVDHLEGMNAAAGGTNIPTLKKVEVPHYEGGGIVNNAATQSMGMEGGVFNNMFNNTLGYQGGGEVTKGTSYSDEFLAEEKQFQSYKDRRLVSEATETKGAVHKVYDDNGKYVGTTYGPSLTEQARFNRMEGRNNLNRKKKKGGGLFGGLKRVVGGTADQLTGNLFDFDKRSGGGLVRKTAGAVGGLFGGGKKEGGTKGSSGILGPISSNVDGMVNRDKYEVQPKSKEKKNTVIAYEQAVNEQQQQNQEATSDGNEIPDFTIRPSFMIDEAKVDVLGIVV